MSGRFTQRGCEAGAQTPPLLRASSPLKPKNQPRTNIQTGTANGGTSTSTSRVLSRAAIGSRGAPDHLSFVLISLRSSLSPMAGSRNQPFLIPMAIKNQATVRHTKEATTGAKPSERAVATQRTEVKSKAFIMLTVRAPNKTWSHFGINRVQAQTNSA